MQKPLIGITMSRQNDAPGGIREFSRQVYVLAIVNAGGLPVFLPNEPSSVQALSYCHGLLLTGGGDFDPVYFGQQPDGTHLDGINPARDQTELALINESDRRGLPVLGICRGMQALAIAGHGTLIQDIPQSRPSEIQHNQTERRGQATHAVTLTPSTRLEKMVKESLLTTNSFHHQAVDQVPPGWLVSAQSADGIIEGIEDPRQPFKIGVQWHPEDLATENQPAALRLFAAFVSAAREYQAQAVTE